MRVESGHLICMNNLHVFERKEIRKIYEPEKVEVRTSKFKSFFNDDFVFIRLIHSRY